MTKKRKVFIIVALVVFILVVVSFLVGRRQRKEETPPLTLQGVDYKGFLPGKSTKGEVLETLGPAIEEKAQQGGSLLLFNSNSPTTDHEAFFQENTLAFFKEIVTKDDGKDIAFLTNQYGEPSYVLFGPASVGGFHLYVYPERGLAYLGNPYGGVLLEIWYFAPTSFEEFWANYASGYSDTFEPQGRF